MLLQLIKKDLLIGKKLTLFSMGIIFAVPFFFMAVGAAFEGFNIISFVYMLFFGVILIFQTVSQIEAKNPKAAALLCAAPYTRKAVVQAKYLLFLLIFVYCYIAHTIVMLIINPSYVLTLPALLAMLFIMAILCGIIIPVEFRYGNVKSKFIFMAMIFTFAMGPSLVSHLLTSLNIVITLPTLSSGPVIGILALGTLLIVGVSMKISMNIYQRKDI